MKKYGILLIAIAGLVVSAAPITVTPQQADIVLPLNARGVQRVAAQELQKHLQLITNVKLPIVTQSRAGRYAFVFPGKPANRTLKPEEAFWQTTPQQTIFYGDDTTYFSRNADTFAIISCLKRYGTVSAVYDFLEKQFNIKWLWPGDDGISYTPSAQLKLETISNTWVPKLIIRSIGGGYLPCRWITFNNFYKSGPTEFRLTKAQYWAKCQDSYFWLLRMRQGRSENEALYTSFQRWWQRFHKTHREYFAMQADGVRRNGTPFRGCEKLCVSNPAVVKQVIADWRAAGMPKMLKIHPSDSRGYCQCPKCLALDVRKPGEKILSHLSDRYIYFANAVAREAKKFRPDVQVLQLAYSDYREPPRREKVDSNIILSMVSFMFEPEDYTTWRFEQWKKAGAQKMIFRPNDPYVNVCIPMGYEKRMFDHFQTAIKNGCYGTQIDSLHHYWQTNGIAEYIVCRAHIYPEQSFEDHMNYYCSAFGPAAQNMSDYFKYWRDVYEQRMAKNAPLLDRMGIYGHYGSAVLNEFVKKYYTEQDFDRTDAILAAALKKSLTTRQKEWIHKYQLANQHGRLMFETLKLSGIPRTKKGAELYRFRLANRDKMNVAWDWLIPTEYTLTDPCAMREGKELAKYLDFARTPFRWNFRMDPQNVGQKENWQKLSYDQLKKSWELLRVDLPWEQQPKGIFSETLRQKLLKYDGIGWYSTYFKIPQEWRDKEVYLFFPGVDESAWLWLNGQYCGKRYTADGSQWTEPFAIRLTDQINWRLPYQQVTLRVEDRAGAGGIYKSPYLVTDGQYKKLSAAVSKENFIANPTFADNFKGYFRKPQYTVNNGVLSVCGAPQLGKANAALFLDGKLQGQAKSYSGQTYRFSFEAQASKLSGALMVAVREGGKKYAVLHRVELTSKNTKTQWNRYYREFTCQSEVTDMKLVMIAKNLAADDQVQLRNLQLELLKKAQ